MTLCFPTKVLDQHLVCLGKTGSGKSSVLRYVVEYLLDYKKRVCVIDPKGDWNGLKVSADGKTSGYSVILFGDFKETAGQSIPADVPLNEYSGKHIAELVTSGNRPCVIGLRGWTQGEMHRFWIDFASTFFNSNEGEFYLIVDEVHNFAPKGKILSPEVGKCLHWTNRLLSEARGLGAVMLIASQRPQKVHNDTLTACETLVAMRVIHKADRDAIDDWIKGCGDPAVGKEVLSSLAGMKRGEAYVWSPEVEFGPKRLTFPMFKTFDSFAPPQLQKKVSGKDWSTVDLAEVEEKLAAVIEKAKAEDPRELNKIIFELRKKLAAKPQIETPEPIVEIREVPVLSNGHLKQLELLLEQLAACGDGLIGIGDGIKSSADSVVTEIARTRTPSEPVQHRASAAAAPARDDSPEPRMRRERIVRRDSDDDADLGKMGRRMLIALAQHPKGLTKKQVLIFSGYRASGSVSKMFARLVREGLVDSPSQSELRITPDGLSRLGHFEKLPQGKALREQLLREASTMEEAFLKVLFEVYPNSVSKGEILKRAGYAASGSVSKTFAKLVAVNYAESAGAAQLRATDELFEAS